MSPSIKERIEHILKHPSQIVWDLCHIILKSFSPETAAYQIAGVVMMSFLYETMAPLIRRFRWYVWALISSRGRKALGLMSTLEACRSYLDWRSTALSLQSVCQPSIAARDAKFKVSQSTKNNNTTTAYSNKPGGALSRAEIAELATRELEERLANERWMESLEPITRGLYIRLREKTDYYRSLVEAKDVEKLKFHLRGELLRKHYGLGRDDESTLHKDQAAKRMLEDYMNIVCEALGLIAYTSDEGIMDDEGNRNSIVALEARMEALQETLTFFNETRHSFGRSALLLSGGARMGLIHAGVCKALKEQRLLPRVISGASAGSIVTAILGSKTDDELEETLTDPTKLNLKFFNKASGATVAGQGTNFTTSAWLRVICLILPPPFGEWLLRLAKLIPGFIPTEYLLDVHTLASAIRDVTGDMTFKESFEKTGRIINITVSPSGDRDFPLLLNYLTAPNVLIWSAAVASSAIPGVFAPVELMAKDINGNIIPNFPEGCRWTDGSVESDLPMQRLSELFNVNHTIVSQVNIHARFIAPILGSNDPFRSFSPEIITLSIPILDWIPRLAGNFDRLVIILIDYLRDQIRSWIRHIADAGLKVPWLRFIGRGFVPLLTQQYHGDITIFPKWSFENAMKLLQNPTNDEYKQCVVEGEQVTWPHVSRIRSHCMIEFMLDDCVQSVRDSLVRLAQDLRAVKTQAQRVTGSYAGLQRKISSNSSMLDSSTNSARSPGVYQFMAPSASVLDMSSLYANQYAPQTAVATNRPKISQTTSLSHSTTTTGSQAHNEQDLKEIQRKLKLRVQSVVDISQLRSQLPVFDDNDEDHEDGGILPNS